MPSNKSDIYNVAEWLSSLLGSDYRPNIGTFVETTATASAQFIIQQAGGSWSSLVYTPRFSIGILTARKDMLGAEKVNKDLRGFINNIQLATSGFPCGASGVRVANSPVGPIPSANGERSYYNMVIELIY